MRPWLGGEVMLLLSGYMLRPSVTPADACTDSEMPNADGLGETR